MENEKNADEKILAEMDDFRLNYLAKNTDMNDDFFKQILSEIKKRNALRESKVNGLSSVEERLKWCEEYIKILLTHKDESDAMHILDGNDISEMKRRLNKLEGDFV